MSDFYDDLNEVMLECLQEFDCRTTPMQFVSKSSKTMNVVTREFEFTEDAAVDIIGITLPFAVNIIDGTSIFEGDIRVIVSNLIEPKNDDTLLIDGGKYSIVNKTPFNAGGITLGYDLQVRK